MRWRKHLPIIGLLAFHLVANWLWVLGDRTPPAWDQAAHLRIAVLLARWLQGERTTALADILHQSGGYPPLVHFGGAVWSMVAGVGIDRVTFFDTVIFLAVIVGVYVLANEIIGSSKWAWWAAAIFSLMPISYDASRSFLLDMAATGWLVWGVFCLIKSGYGRDWYWWLGLAGCMVGISLTKLNGVIYFVPVVGVAWWQMWRNKDGEWWLKMVVLGALMMGGVGWWWMTNVKQIFEYLTGLAGQGEPLTDPMNLFSWETWIHYYRLFFLNQVTPLAGVVLTGLVVGGVRSKKWQHRGLVIGLVVVNYVVFTVIKNKDMRFTMPILPMVAVMAVAGAKEMANKWQYLVLGILMAYWGWFYVNNSFGWPIAKDYRLSWPTAVMGNMDVVNVSDYPVRQARAGDWPQEAIVKAMDGYASRLSRRPKVLVLVNKEEINDNNLALYRDLEAKNSFDLGSVGGRVKFGSQKELSQFVANFDAYLVAEASFDPAPFYGINLEAYKQARDYVLGRMAEMEELGKYRIYGDKEMWLVAKN